MPNQIFVSFSTKDLQSADTILAGLKDRGITSIFMSADPEQGIRAGEEWRKRLETELRYARVFMPLISENWLASSWCHAELRIAKFMGMSVFPVHIGKADTRGITGEIDELQGLQAYLLNHDLMQALTTRLGEQLKLRRGRWDGQLNRLYPAAAAYQPDQAAVFFGRDAEIAALRREVSATLERENPSERVLIYSGASGVGKSSLVRAGLLPELTVDPSVLVLGPLRPLDGMAEPSESLTYGLLRMAARRDAGDAELANALAEISGWIAAGPPGLVDGLKRIAKLRTARDLVIVIDQAEEWLLDDAHVIAQRTAILELLGASWRRMACILITRDDAIAKLDALIPRGETGRATQTLLLRPMARDQLREVIRGPLEIASLIPLASDPRTEAFVDAVLEDAESATDALPLVSQLMARLVGEGTGGTTVERYREIGGLAGAIAMSAEQCLGENPSDDLLAAVRSAFMAMAQVEPSGQVRIGRAELDQIAPEARPVLDRMAAAGLRLLRKTSDTIEPTHESLLRRWPRLEEWLRDEAVRLGALAQALRDAADWERSGRRPDLLLHRGERLEVVRPLLDDPVYVSKFHDALDYLSACYVLQDAQAKERRARAIGVSSALSRLLANKAREAHTKGLHTTAMRFALAGWLEGALNGGDTAHAEAALSAAAQASRHLTSCHHNSDVTGAAISPDGLRVVTASADNTCAIWNVNSGDQIATFVHHGKINAVSFSPSGSQVVTASHDRTSVVWDARSGERIASFPHKGSVNNAAFSTDGSRVVTASSDKTSVVWDARSGESIVSFQHLDKVGSAAFSPDGSRVVTASNDKTSVIWNSRTGEQLAKFHHKGYIRSACFSPDGLRVVTASDDKTSVIWDARTGDKIACLLHLDLVKCAVFSPDGSRVVTASSDKTSVVWDARTGNRIASFQHESGVRSAAFSPDGSCVVTASGDKASVLWDVRTSTRIASLPLQGRVMSARFSRDRSRIVTTSVDKTCIIWDARRSDRIASFPNLSQVLSAAFSPDGARVVTASVDKVCVVWRVGSGERVAALQHQDVVLSAAFSPDGSSVVTASGEKASLWDVRSGDRIAIFQHENWVKSAAFSPDGSSVVTASGEKASLWDVRSGDRIAIFQHENWVKSAAFSPDGSSVVTAWGEKASLWDVRSGDRIATFQHENGVRCAAFSPDGSCVVTASGEKASLWDARSGGGIANFQHAGPVRSAVFSPDGSRAVTASSDKTSVVWDTRTGNRIASFQHESGVRSAAFSPDGSCVVTASDDSSSVIWDVRTGYEIASFWHQSAVLSAAFSPDGSRIVTTVRGRGETVVWDTFYASQLRAQHLVEVICANALVGAEHFSADELRDSSVARLPQDIVAACLKALVDIEAREGARR